MGKVTTSTIHQDMNLVNTKTSSNAAPAAPNREYFILFLLLSLLAPNREYFIVQLFLLLSLLLFGIDRIHNLFCLSLKMTVTAL